MDTLWERFQETVTRLFRWFGTEPDWTEISDPTGAPDASDAGVELDGAVKTLVKVPLREEAHRKTGYIDVVHDGSTTYQVDVDEETVTADGGDNLPETLDNIRDAINDDADMSEIVEADIYTPDSGDDQVRLRGKGEDDFDLDVSIDSGDGEISATVDPDSATARIWFMDDGGPESWDIPPETDGIFDIDRRGLTERLSTAGYDRIYVEVDVEEPDGDDVSARSIRSYVGPGVME